MSTSCYNGSLLFLAPVSNDLVYPFRALLFCSILVLGVGSGLIAIIFFVLHFGIGLNPSLNSSDGCIMLCSCSHTLCFTLFPEPSEHNRGIDYTGNSFVCISDNAKASQTVVRRGAKEKTLKVRRLI